MKNQQEKEHVSIYVIDYLKSIMQKYFIVHTALDGIEALQTLKKLKPDLIISDVMMPLMDGMVFYKRIKALTGQTPADYVKTMRMNRAAELGISPKKYQQGESPAG